VIKSVSLNFGIPTEIAFKPIDQLKILVDEVTNVEAGLIPNKTTGTKVPEVKGGLYL